MARPSSSSLASPSSIVGVHYKVGRKIGEGSFGIIYEGMFYWIPPSPFTFTVHEKRERKHTPRPDNSLFCSKHYTGTNLISNQQIAIKFESRKSEAPQLRDEYRTYKILSGVGMCQGEVNMEKARVSNKWGW